VTEKKKTLILTVGLPRSGKSTWAIQQGFPVVSPDAVRVALHGKKQAVRDTERMVWTISQYMVRSLFFAGHERVILDACSATRKRRSKWRDSNWMCKYKVFEVDLEVCCARVEENNPNRLNLLASIVRVDADYQPVDPDEGELI